MGYEVMRFQTKHAIEARAHPAPRTFRTTHASSRSDTARCIMSLSRVPLRGSNSEGVRGRRRGAPDGEEKA